MNFHLAFDKTTLQFTILLSTKLLYCPPNSISFLVMFQPAVSQGELTNQVHAFETPFYTTQTPRRTKLRSSSCFIRKSWSMEILWSKTVLLQWTAVSSTELATDRIRTSDSTNELHLLCVEMEDSHLINQLLNQPKSLLGSLYMPAVCFTL